MTREGMRKRKGKKEVENAERGRGEEKDMSKTGF